MKVYVLLEKYYYDYGDESFPKYDVRIFSSREKAEEYIDRALSSLADEYVEKFMEDFEIIDYEVDSGIPVA